MPHRIFRLNSSTFAILYENDQRTVVTIPANALVTVVVGEVEADGLIKIRYEHKVLVMLAVDLRRRAERVWQEQQSA